MRAEMAATKPRSPLALPTARRRQRSKRALLVPHAGLSVQFSVKLSVAFVLGDRWLVTRANDRPNRSLWLHSKVILRWQSCQATQLTLLFFRPFQRGQTAGSRYADASSPTFSLALHGRARRVLCNRRDD